QEITSLGGGFEYYQTQYELIKSRAVIERAIAALRLKRSPEIGNTPDPYRALGGALIVEPKRNTRLVFVRYEHKDSAFGAEMANGIAAAYARYNVEAKLSESRQALAWLTDEMSTLKRRVQESSGALQDYRVKSGILGLEEQRKITAQKIMDFNKAYL